MMFVAAVFCGIKRKLADPKSINSKVPNLKPLDSFSRQVNPKPENSETLTL